MTTRLVTALVLGAAVSVAGCGGSSQSTSSMTPANFRTTLGALCVRANRAFASASGSGAQSAVVRRYVPRFESLRPPAQLQSLYSHYLAVLRRESAALKAGNTAVLTELVTTRARPLARKLGALSCVT